MGGRRVMGGRRARGQILVVFALGMVVLLLMAGLVLDGAQALVLRRQLQDAGDAAALAAANVIQSGSPRGCSATPGSPPGAPRAEATAAAVASVQANIPGKPASSIHVTCADGWSNWAVSVTLDDHSSRYFGGVAGIDGFAVSTESQAVNGQVTSTRYSIVELDPGNPTWPNGRRGCPSVLVSGGPTIILEGSVMIDSNCPATSGGPLGTNGNAATVQLLNGATIRMVGPYVKSTLTITPSPVQVPQAIKDPLASLPAIPVSALPVRSQTKMTIGGGSAVLDPGVYVGGIKMKSSAKAFLRPGIYVMQGGGFDIGALNAVYSVAAGKSSTTDATWAADCPEASCGVLLFNTGVTGSTDQISIGAGATMKLRPYRSATDGSAAKTPEYENMLVWQDASPAPNNAFLQPDLYLNGGGSVDISGGVYAPSAVVHMGGGSGGSGGNATDLTLQFISWDLELQGNSASTSTTAPTRSRSRPTTG